MPLGVQTLFIVRRFPCSLLFQLGTPALDSGLRIMLETGARNSSLEGMGRHGKARPSGVRNWGVTRDKWPVQRVIMEL